MSTLGQKQKMTRVERDCLPNFGAAKPYSVAGRLFHPVLLAPLSGITDRTFRAIIRKASGLPVLPCLTFSEMVASKAVLNQMKDSQKLTLGEGDPEGMVVQLAGTDAQTCAEAATMVEARGAIGLDLNFGCPARKVVKKAAGSSLMRDEALCAAIFEAVVRAVSIPVTVKMRLGWDYASLNAPKIAKRAEDAGVKALTVHGRTRCQFYQGEADWSAVAAVREVVDLPLVVNGDICCFETAKTALTQARADHLMVGRASVGQPWLLGEIARHFADMSQIGNLTPEATIGTNLSYADKAALIPEHLEMALQKDGLFVGIRSMRKHLLGYAQSLIADEARRETFFRTMLKTLEAQPMFDLIQYHFETLSDEKALKHQGLAA